MRVIFSLLVLCCWAAPSPAADAGPPSLDEAVEILLRRALDGHPGLREAALRAEAAEARVLQAGALSETVLSLEAGDNDSWAPWQAGELTLGVTQPLGRPSLRAGEREVARLEADRAALASGWVRKRLAMDLKGAAIEAVHRAALARHWEGMEALAEQVEATVTLKYRGGEAPYAEVLRARLETLRARNRLRQAERERQASRAALARRAGLTVEALPILPDHLPADREVPPLEECLTAGLEGSLALREALMEESIADARGRLAALAGAPEWTVGLFVQRLKNQPPFDAGAFEGTEGNAWGASAEMSLPLFGGAKRRAARIEAEALHRAAGSRRADLEREIRRAVAAAHGGLEASVGAVADFEDGLLPELEKALRAVRDQYTYQQADASDLFTIYAAYREARGEFLDALRGAADARIAVEAASDPGPAAGAED
jgi:outer membrane protein TolC